ncbi:HAMP domain-containing histidine kinase [Candidatus Saccharibacteria bacterium]|nr:HAMP domain-containing histidine kinase [Candidatus Saccharibacteria bacterium]
MFTVVLFTYFFPEKRPLKYLKAFSIYLGIVGLLSFTKFIAGDVEISNKGYVFSYGAGTIFYSVAFLIGILLIGRNLLLDIKKFTIESKKQARIVATGFIFTFFVGLFLSLVLPGINQTTKLDDLSPFSLILFLSFTGYAIVKHKLFDFRALVVRSLSYILAISVFSTFYVLALYLIRRVLFPSTSITTSQLVSNVVVGLIIVVTYPRLKVFFDKITKKLFFRDAYDPQVLLDKLNQTLVTNVDLDMLLNKSAVLISEGIKSVSTNFYIRETSYFDSRTIGTQSKLIPKSEIEIIQDLAAKLHKKVHTTEQDAVDPNENELNKLLSKNGIEVMARLVSTLDYEVKGIGYIFLGPKKSGSLYTSQDIKIMEIIANELVIAIENVLRFEEIEQFNVTLQKKIDDATSQLKQTNEKLLALDEAKDEFVSMASHQLRTPLTSIKGYISMVLEEDAGKINDTQKQMLGQAMFSSQRMVYLISDLLNVSRLKTGKFIIEPKPVYLPDLVESELTQLYEGASAKNITLAFDKPKKFPTLNLDDMKIRQVVMNFTDNAIYYTPNGGKITLELKDKRDSIEFRVKDTGIGVPKAEQHKLFAKFYRADNARKARPDGTGLGLFMAKKVIVAQGGSIIFDSKEGKGSTFGFSFPKEKLLVNPEKQ